MRDRFRIRLPAGDPVLESFITAVASLDAFAPSMRGFDEAATFQQNRPSFIAAHQGVRDALKGYLEVANSRASELPVAPRKRRLGVGRRRQLPGA
jgi:hypothetical protein